MRPPDPLQALQASLDSMERSIDQARTRLDAFKRDPAYAFAHRVTAASEADEYLRVLDHLDHLDHLDQEGEACT